MGVLSLSLSLQLRYSLFFFEIDFPACMIGKMSFSSVLDISSIRRLRATWLHEKQKKKENMGNLKFKDKVKFCDSFRANGPQIPV